MSETAARPPTVAFLHVGPDIQLPTVMVRSVRRHNPDARIIQCADEGTPPIEGVDEVHRLSAGHGHMMAYRVQCFASLPTPGPTWFIDSDMICNRRLVFDGGPSPQVAVCLREFEADAVINPQPGAGLDMSEYGGRRVADVYPYVGCATLVENCQFWTACLAQYQHIDPKYFSWFGDQEAIRNVVDSGRYTVGFLPESKYACLPEYETPGLDPVISHYKGRRKSLMLERAAREGLL